MLLSLSIIFFFNLIAGSPLLTGFPRGGDTPIHMVKILFIEENWPYVRWSHEWGSGCPLFLEYPPGSYYISLCFQKMLNVSLFDAYKLVSFASVLFAAFAIYFFMKTNFKGELAALAAAILYLATPTSWNFLSYWGFFPQSVAVPFLIFMLVFYGLYQRRERKRYLIASIFCYTLVLLTHQFLSFVGPFLLGVYALALVIASKASFWKSIIIVFTLGVASLCLAGFWYLPYLTSYLRITMGMISAGTTVEIRYLDLPSLLGTSPSSNFLRLALWLDIFALVGAVFAVKKRGLFLFPLILSILTIILSLEPAIGVLSFLYLERFMAIRLLILIGIFLSMLAGIGFSELVMRANALVNRKGRRTVFRRLLVVSFILLIFAPTSLYMRGEEERSTYHLGTYNLSERISEHIDGEFSRILVHEGGLSETLSLVTKVPQAGSYIGNLLIPDWLEFVHEAFYGEIGGKKTVQYLADWFGVKYVTITDQHASLWKYDSDLWSPIWSQDGFLLLRYANATSIISASNVPVVLIVGNDIAYNNIFCGLSACGCDTHSLILVRGSDCLEDYSLEELDRFDVVVLYGYSYRDRDKSWALLAEYVKNGGGLVIDTGYSPDTGGSMPAPCPVKEVNKSAVNRDWHSTYIDYQITNGIDFSSFSPAIYEGGPWGVSASGNDSVHSWAQPIFWDEGRPLVVCGQQDKGRVIWSGLNLPYHVLTYGNYWEALFLANMIKWASGAIENLSFTDNYMVKRESPERIEIRVNEKTSGVLVRECYFGNWHAYIEVESGPMQNLKIYKAGPDFMYVHVPSNVEPPARVFFEYGWTWSEIAGYAISVITFAVLVMYTIGLPVRKLVKSTAKRQVRQEAS